MEVVAMRSTLVTGVELLLAEGQPLILQIKMVVLYMGWRW
jgi:hypothetical protein